MIKKCFSILFILCTSLSFAQNERYKLTFEIQDKVASKVFIFKQFGSSRDIVDSLIYVAGKSEIVFTNQPKGLYVLTYQYETSLQDDPQAIAEIDFIFHQNDIHFIIKHHDKNAFVDVITSEENKIWHQFKKAEAHRSDQVKYVFTTKNIFEDEKDIIKALRAKLKKENTEQKKTLKKAKNNYDKSFASKLIYHISQTVPPFEFDEDEIFPFVSKDLFERCAFDDENLLNANVYENIVFNYIISQYQKYSNRNEQEAAVLKSVEQIMLKAEKNEAIKNKMLDFIMNGLTQLKANVALNYLMEKYPDAEKCISQAEKENHKIEINIGDTLPQQARTIIESHKNYAQKHKTLLIFWASWCPYSEQLRNELMKFNLPEDLNLIVISLSKSLEKCETDQLLFSKRYNFHCEGKIWDNELVNLTGVNAIPSLILVDKSGKVIQMPENLSDLQLKSH
jgi:thiol-disulfide isomerase/thioredoxin